MCILVWVCVCICVSTLVLLTTMYVVSMGAQSAVLPRKKLVNLYSKLVHIDQINMYLGAEVIAAGQWHSSGFERPASS